MENEKEENKKRNGCELDIEDCDFCVIKNICPLDPVDTQYSRHEIHDDHVRVVYR